MATQAAPQTLDSALDLDGLSVITTTRTALAPRQGLIYNPATLAAAEPIWFHRLNDGRYLSLLRQHWLNATVGTTAPQSYTAHDAVTSPATVIVDPSGNTGSVVPLSGQMPGVRVANGAASRFGGLYTVGTLDGVAHLSWHRVLGDALLFGGEEILPAIPAISFHRGCYIDGDWLYVFGTDTTNQIHLARKRWSRVGFDDRTPTYTWEYLGDKGWLADPAALSPLMAADGSALTTVGAVSCVRHRDRRLLVAVHADGAGLHTPVGYVGRDVDSRWRPVSFEGPPLGDTTTFLGGGCYLQPLNPALSAIPVGAFTAFPAVASVLASSGGEYAILTSWVAWPLSR